jgi:ZIP family zinc transporter
LSHLLQFWDAISGGRVASSPALLAVGLGVVALATLAGAWLAGGRGGRRQVWFGAAAGALLVIALLHLLPDAWAGAEASRVPAWLVPVVAVLSFMAMHAVSRVGCACEADEEHASGTGAAAALAVHRLLEGAAMVLTGLITAVALAVHAFGEGMAVGALLRQQRRRLAVWLALMCIGPVVGAWAASAIPALDIAEPLLLALAAGVLAQAARISLRAAFPRRHSEWRLAAAPTVALMVAASLTALAVHAVG